MSLSLGHVDITSGGAAGAPPDTPDHNMSMEVESLLHTQFSMDENFDGPSADYREGLRLRDDVVIPRRPLPTTDSVGEDDTQGE